MSIGYIPRWSAVAGLASLLATPVAAQTPPPPKVFTACYVPLVGLVYLVGEDKTPADCLRGHIKVSWGQQGPKGDKGDKGDPGTPGNLALAGQACPAGQFVTGFSSSGTIMCVAAGGEPPPPPPPPPSSAFAGLWPLTPTISTPCTGPGSAFVPTLTVDQVTTSLSSPSELSLVSRVMLGPATSFPNFTFAFDEASPTFAGSSQFSQNVGGGGVNLTVAGSFAITGEFAGPDGPLTITLALNSFTIVGSVLGIQLNVQCADLTATATGTRAGT